MKKNEKMKKIYESPSLTVTELDTKDVIMVSGLITVDENLILGHGTINFAEIIEMDIN